MYMPTLVVCQFRGKGPDVGASRVEVVGLSDPCLKLADEHLGLLVCNPAFAGGTGQLSDAVVPRLISATGHHDSITVAKPMPQEQRKSLS